jgi:hypothetical protein
MPAVMLKAKAGRKSRDSTRMPADMPARDTTLSRGRAAVMAYNTR